VWDFIRAISNLDGQEEAFFCADEGVVMGAACPWRPDWGGPFGVRLRGGRRRFGSGDPVTDRDLTGGHCHHLGRWILSWGRGTASAIMTFVIGPGPRPQRPGEGCATLNPVGLSAS